ncbi:MAG: nucleotidyltransferase domain-containing protein [Deltaproteobacteria bacterium]|nr:nucleotidyltransferase domain-containing protein [Deltaproteobacteria bacterium]
MYAHHQDAIQRSIQHFSNDSEVLALILGGSIAHGFATAASDVDVMILVSDRDYEARLRDGRLQYYDPTLCAYEGGYVDGKYLGEGFLQKIAAAGSEPARFAFQDAQVLFSGIAGLATVLGEIVRYPLADKAARLQRFYAQFEVWHWYAHEALKLRNRYLLGVAANKMVLFAGRLILAHNELLYPYHKWFLAVLERAADKPRDLLAQLAALTTDPSPEHIRSLYETIVQFRPWECTIPWTTQFMLDSELNWLDGRSPVEDV